MHQPQSGRRPPRKQYNRNLGDRDIGIKGFTGLHAYMPNQVIQIDELVDHSDDIAS